MTWVIIPQKCVLNQNILDFSSRKFQSSPADGPGMFDLCPCAASSEHRHDAQRKPRDGENRKHDYGVVLLVNLELGIKILDLRGHRQAFLNPASFSTFVKLIFTVPSPSSYPIVLSLKTASLCLPLVAANSVITSEKPWYGSDPPPGRSLAPDGALP